jgi:hypothetical protein
MCAGIRRGGEGQCARRGLLLQCLYLSFLILYVANLSPQKHLAVNNKLQLLNHIAGQKIRQNLPRSAPAPTVKCIVPDRTIQVGPRVDRA